MAIPIPGQAVRGSKTGKPIMALFDLLGRTWCLGIIWQLRESPATFRELQLRCEDISPTLLNSRLKELAALGLVIKTPHGYDLSQHAQLLAEHIKPMAAWSQTWADLLLKGTRDV
ncbi:winged helix-turn-helix transcriptional regulator [Pseudoalteromonas tunicata]|uniref:winged helix-turn-helix transcriptional regulator n=1 Tax=Pseudoalteromonas tunicata TaxID=314281 RepID=UPI00273E00D7|nr:helix-turn-helix domain-containing protein [Pseudoalteromonas tunicata]MDP4982966.1 helix-turn-helix transcriptional regulator [Pseudoalteromonas tunicata]